MLLEGISPARRARLHRLIGIRLEAGYADRAFEISAELASHFEQAGDGERAVVYFQHAGNVDRRRSAHGGAERHFRRALALLENLPASGERDAREAVLRVAHAGELIATQGFGAPAVEQSWGRALDRSQSVDVTPHLLDVLGGLWVFYLNRGPLRTAREIADRLFECTERSDDPSLLLEAHHAKWCIALMGGDLDRVLFHTDQAMALCRSGCDGASTLTYGCTLRDAHLKNHSAKACAAGFRGWAQALAGRTETAARTLDEAVAHARDFRHPYTLAVALVMASAALHVARDADAARKRAADAAVVAREHGFGLILAWAAVYEGRALADLGEMERALKLMREGLATCHEARLPLFQPFQLVLAGEAQLRAGQFDESARSLDKAFAIAVRTGETFFAAERHRVRGELHLATARDAESRRLAEEDLRAAIEISRSQGARLLTLRASTSLARMLAGTAASAEVLALLSAARNEVRGQRDLPDLADAARVLAHDEAASMAASPGQQNAQHAHPNRWCSPGISRKRLETTTPRRPAGNLE